MHSRTMASVVRACVTWLAASVAKDPLVSDAAAVDVTSFVLAISADDIMADKQTKASNTVLPREREREKKKKTQQNPKL